MKAWKFLSIPLMLMLVSGMPWSDIFAADVTEPVAPAVGESVTVGNVTVEDEHKAVDLVSGEGETTSVKVEGDVSLTNGDGAKAVSVVSGNSDSVANADIKGNVSANSETGSTYGIYATTGDENYDDGTGKANVTVGGNVSASDSSSTDEFDSAYGVSTSGTVDLSVDGNVSAKGNTNAIGVNVDNDSNENGANIFIGGDVKAEGPNATGLNIGVLSGETRVNLDGNIIANGNNTTGVQLTTFGNQDGNTSITLDIAKNITATAKGMEYSANGIIVENGGGNITADIGGNVTANADEFMTGIAIYEADTSEDEAPQEGTNKITIRGNLISPGAGIYASNVGSPVETFITIENTIKSENIGILLEKGSNYDPDVHGRNPDPKLHLTVWKVELNENGNVAEWEEPMRRKAARDFEKKIKYIIKVEQPSAGGTIRATNANGKALAQDNYYEIAYEGDKVLVKPYRLKKGFKIVGAYNGYGKEEKLQKDKNGNYYIIVPKGGGIYLSVELEDSSGHYYSDIDSDGNALYNNDSEQKSKKGRSSEYETSALSYAESSKTTTESGSTALGPKTGDNEQINPWLLLSTISIGGIIGLEVYNKKNSLKKASEE